MALASASATSDRIAHFRQRLIDTGWRATASEPPPPVTVATACTSSNIECAIARVRDIAPSRLLRLSRELREAGAETNPQVGTVPYNALIQELHRIRHAVLTDAVLEQLSTPRTVVIAPGEQSENDNPLDAPIEQRLDNLAESLATLERDWDDVDCEVDSAGRLVLAGTTRNTVVVRNVDFGKMRVRFVRPSGPAIAEDCDVRVLALTPRVSDAYGYRVVHPNVAYHSQTDGGTLCFGSGRAAIMNAMRREDVLSLFDIVSSILVTPSNSPYGFPEYWDLVRMPCGHHMPPEYAAQRPVCACCGRFSCWTCLAICLRCGREICSNCGHYADDVTAQSWRYRLQLPELFNSGIFANFVPDRESGYNPPRPPMPDITARLLCQTCSAYVSGTPIISSVSPHPWAHADSPEVIAEQLQGADEEVEAPGEDDYDEDEQF